MPLTDPDIVKQWASPAMDSARDDELDRACVAATEWVKRAAHWDIEEAAQTIYLDGHDAIGSSQEHVLLMPSRYRPVIHSGGTLVTITEDGEALTVTDVYDETKDVYLVGANFNRRLELIRYASPWLHGYANVAVTFTAGYAVGSVPDDIVQLATEVALLIFRAQNFVGKGSKSGRGGGVSYEKELSPIGQMTLDRISNGAEAQ